MALSRPSSGHPASAQDKELRVAFERAQALHRLHGKSYYFATQLFPRPLRQATYAIYAFVRVPDEIVDNSPQSTPDERAAIALRLNQWRHDWQQAYAQKKSADPVLHVASLTYHAYNIPPSTAEDFIDAMIQDLEQGRYRDFDDLKGYMWGSACVVGVMMSHLIGFKKPEALQHAAKLGYAMQLTNFLRDIDEDFQLRNRIYMPQDELARFGLSDDDIAQRRFSPAFREFMKFQAQRAHGLYEEANAGIPMLDRQGRGAVLAASTLYRAILDKLEAQNWNPFTQRAKTNLPEKVWHVGKALATNPVVWRS
jgi:phytoene synthase